MQPAWPAIVDAVYQGSLIAYPTEAVWGLGCDPWNEAAVSQLLALKRRPVTKGLILVAGDEAIMAPYLEHLSAPEREQVSATWPGPVTWLVPAPHWVPHWITGGQPTLAVRVSAHPVIARLTARLGEPLVSTSANRTGCPPARHRFQVKRWFGDQVALMMDGALGGDAQPTTIRDLSTGTTLR